MPWFQKKKETLSLLYLEPPKMCQNLSRRGILAISSLESSLYPHCILTVPHCTPAGNCLDSVGETPRSIASIAYPARERGCDAACDAGVAGHLSLKLSHSLRTRRGRQPQHAL